MFVAGIECGLACTLKQACIMHISPSRKTGETQAHRTRSGERHGWGIRAGRSNHIVSLSAAATECRLTQDIRIAQAVVGIESGAKAGGRDGNRDAGTPSPPVPHGPLAP